MDRPAPLPDLVEIVGDLVDAVGLIEAATDNDAREPNGRSPRKLLEAAIALVEPAATRLEAAIPPEQIGEEV